MRTLSRSSSMQPAPGHHSQKARPRPPSHVELEVRSRHWQAVGMPTLRPVTLLSSTHRPSRLKPNEEEVCDCHAHQAKEEHSRQLRFELQSLEAAASATRSEARTNFIVIERGCHRSIFSAARIRGKLRANASTERARKQHSCRRSSHDPLRPRPPPPVSPPLPPNPSRS